MVKSTQTLLIQKDFSVYSGFDEMTVDDSVAQTSSKINKRVF